MTCIRRPAALVAVLALAVGGCSDESSDQRGVIAADSRRSSAATGGERDDASSATGPRADPTPSGGDPTSDPTSGGGDADAPGSPPTTTHGPGASGGESEGDTPSEQAGSARFEADRAMAVVRTLAGRIGPREATSSAYSRAARLVQRRFEALGYGVDRQAVPVPAGVSWGVPVPAGRSTNVIADPPGFDPRAPHLVVGAHLDTVPQAPGAEDNASGVAVVLELARLAARQPTRLPVRFIAFGAEEPRGEGERGHHFGSRLYVRRLDQQERTAMRGMLSLDRVGVTASQVPVCTGGSGRGSVQRAVTAAAEAVEVATEECVNTASDHYSFERQGMPAARLGGVPYAGYHSAGDVPRVVDRAQLARSGAVAWSWLRPARDRA